MTTDARYLAVQIKTSCPHCGNPLVVNGPLKSPMCTSCNTDVRLRPGLWSSVLEDAERAVLKLGLGEGYNSQMMTGGFNLAVEYIKANFTCTDCEQEWDLNAVATGTDGTFKCPKCGHESDTYPAPPWLTAVIPTASQVFFAERSVEAKEGQVTADLNDAANKPVVFSCPQCAGALKLNKDSDRTVTCSFCDADVYLPDGLWAKLHPVKTANHWCIRFEGDYYALKSALKAKKKVEKERKKAEKKALKEQQ